MVSKVQISCSYQTNEDRILVRARLSDKDVRMWFTRRMTLQFLSSIGKIFDHISGVQAQPKEQREAVSEFRREAALGKANFQTPYQEQGLEPYPTDGPLLVKKLNIATLDTGGVRLTLSGDHSEGVRLNFGEKELHAVVHMLQQCADKAQWALGTPLAKKPKLVN